MINIETIKESNYILRVIVFDALNRQGDYISHFSLKDYNLHLLEDEFSKPESAESEFYWVNEHTCPSNIIDTNVELLDGKISDPHGVLTLIGYLPESLISRYTNKLYKDSDGDIDFTNIYNTDFFNLLLRLYKSLYHMMRSCYIYDSMEYNKFGQPYYFTPFTNEQNSRINYIVCELLSNDNNLLGLVTPPEKGRIIDINQDEDEINGNYNGLIYGLPQFIFDNIGYDRLMEILGVKDNIFILDEERIIESYHNAKHIKKVITND